MKCGGLALGFQCGKRGFPLSCGQGVSAVYKGEYSDSYYRLSEPIARSHNKDNFQTHFNKATMLFYKIIVYFLRY